MLMPLVEVTSNYIISGEARKSQENVAEFATGVMRFIEYFGFNVDIQLTDPSDMTFTMFFFNDEQLILEITAWANSQAKGEKLGADKMPIPLTFL